MYRSNLRSQQIADHSILNVFSTTSLLYYSTTLDYQLSQLRLSQAPDERATQDNQKMEVVAGRQPDNQE